MPTTPIFSQIQKEFDWIKLNSRAQSKRLPLFMAEWAIRHATARFRGLANCSIVGAQKAGSSSLYYYLNQHPQVKETFGKELHYFDGSLIDGLDTYKKGKPWYQAHFPLNHTLKKGDICLDASPLYLFHPLVAERIHQLIPDCKIIMLLRNPVERAISHYFHVKKLGGETLSIEAALAQENKRLAGAIQTKNYKDADFRKYSYQARGLYWQQIQQYLKFFKREQILIINSDDFFQQTPQVLNRIFEFLAIDPDYAIADLQAKNIGSKKEHVSSEVYQRLSEYYRQPNEALFNGIGERFDWD